MLKKSLVSLLVGISIIGLVGCGYKPKHSEEFYENYVRNYNEQIEITNEWQEYYGLEPIESKYKLPLTDEQKKEIDEIYDKTFTQ